MWRFDPAADYGPLDQAARGHYGRIFKTLHILRLADDEPYRREGKAQANLTEGRHDLGRRIYHGKKGEMTRTYIDGHYAFHLPDFGGDHRPLRDPDALDQAD